jgi:two-component system response regulator RegX3
MTGGMLRPPDRAGSDPRPLVLVVDDEASYREALSAGLSREGFGVSTVAGAGEAVRALRRARPDIVLLDLMLPGDEPGIELCRRLRSIAPVPVIVVTARTSEVDVVLALEVGAADYVTKPFLLRELVARIRAVLRRDAPKPSGADEVLRGGPVSIDTARREVSVDGRVLDLPRREYELLVLLVAHLGQVVSRERCIERLWWDRDLADTRTLDTHVRRLRCKIERDPADPRLLVTVRGVGFRFET